MGIYIEGCCAGQLHHARQTLKVVVLFR